MNIEELEKILPHGSGINGDWSFEDKGDHIVACNCYDCMNEAGFYVAYIDFSLTIPKDSPRDFKLHFHTDSRGWYWIRAIMLRDYLEDTIAQKYTTFLKEHE